MANVIQFQKGKVGAVGVINAPPLPKDLPELRRGAKGDLVLQLQRALNSLGFGQTSAGPLREDGDFGAETEAAVRAFQLSAGLLGMGVAEVTTWTALAIKGKTFMVERPSNVVPMGRGSTALALTAGAAPTPVRPMWQTGLMIFGGIAAVGLVLYLINEKMNGGGVSGFDRFFDAKPVGSGSTKCPRTPAADKLVEGEVLEAM